MNNFSNLTDNELIELSRKTRLENTNLYKNIIVHEKRLGKNNFVANFVFIVTALLLIGYIISLFALDYGFFKLIVGFIVFVLCVTSHKLQKQVNFINEPIKQDLSKLIEDFEESANFLKEIIIELENRASLMKPIE